MGRKDNNLIIIAVIAIIAVLVLGGGGGLFSIFGGFSTLSLDESSFVSNDPELNGPVWNLELVQNGVGSNAVGSGLVATDGNKVSDKFTVTAVLSKLQIKYPIVRDNIGVFNVVWEKRLFILGCPSDFTHSHRDTFEPDVWCYKFTQVGQHANIGDESVVVSSLVQIATDDGKGSWSCSINNEESRTCNLKDDFGGSSTVGRVRWEGNLVSGESVPEPDGNSPPLSAVYDQRSFQEGWKMIDDDEWEFYLDYSRGGFENCLQKTNFDTRSCFTLYNQVANKMMVGKCFNNENTDCGSADGSLSSGQIVLNSGKAYQFPLLTLKVKSDALSIFEPVTIPKINGCRSPDFSVGNSGFIEVDVENEGDTKGNMDYGIVSCDVSEFSQHGTINSVTLDAGQEKTVVIPIRFGGTDDASSTCEVILKDGNNPDNFDTRDCNVEATSDIKCADGEQIPGITLTTIEECVDGTFSVVESCDVGESVVSNNGKLVCTSNDDADCGLFGLSCINNPLDNFFDGVQNFFLGFGILVLVGGGIFVFLFVTGRVGRGGRR